MTDSDLTPHLNHPRPVEHIYYLAERNRKLARAVFAAKFEMNAEDRVIEDDLERLFREQHEQDEHILIPAKLVLGLVLRSTRGVGRGRRSPGKERWARRQANLAIRIAQRRWAELVQEGVNSKVAKERAAKEVEPSLRREYEFARLSLSTLKSRMNLSRGKRDLKND